MRISNLNMDYEGESTIGYTFGFRGVNRALLLSKKTPPLAKESHDKRGTPAGGHSATELWPWVMTVSKLDLGWLVISNVSLQL